MSKLTVVCLDFRALQRNTLQGFAKIAVKEMRLVIHDVALHQKGDRRWIALPSKAQIDKNRELIKEGDGKIRYAPVLEFESRSVTDAFGDAVVRAIADFLAHPGRLAG